MTRQRRMRAHDLDPLRAAIHGRGGERLVAELVRLRHDVGAQRGETYLDVALEQLRAIAAEADRRLTAADEARASRALVEAAAATAMLARGELARAAHSGAATAAIAEHLAASKACGADADDRRSVLVAITLERGCNGREAAHVANVVLLPAAQWPSQLAVLPHERVAGERSAERLLEDLIDDERKALDASERRLEDARTASGDYAHVSLLEDNEREWLIAELEAGRRAHLQRLARLGDSDSVRIWGRDLFRTRMPSRRRA